MPTILLMDEAYLTKKYLHKDTASIFTYQVIDKKEDGPMIHITHITNCDIKQNQYNARVF